MRKLATIKKIDKITAIDGAEMVCIYSVGGWNVVDTIGKYEVDQLVVFVEVDSFIPAEVAPFLTAPDRFPKEYLGIKGERLRTKKLKGVVSQGLILPCSILGYSLDVIAVNEGVDVSDKLGIVKYDPPLPAQLAGQVKGNFPSLVPKTDEERVQNLTKQWPQMQEEGDVFEVTEKLEGSSCTFYLDAEGNFEVCSRNLSLKEDENNSFWKAALMYNIKEKMLEQGLHGMAIQGELIGEGIQGNIYNLKGIDFYCYTIWNTATGSYLSAVDRTKIVKSLDLKQVPYVGLYTLRSIEEVLQGAEGKSALNPKQEREGVVYKSMNNPEVHFKAISNKYLLKQKE